MTVKREQMELFDISAQEVMKIIRAILMRGQADYKYENTVESGEALTFKTIIKPSRPLLLSTKMQIQIEGMDSKTKVVVETKSQWFIFGDIADFYGGYIRDIFGSIHSEKMVQQSIQTRPNNDTNYKVRIIIFAICLGVIVGLVNLFLFYLLGWRK